MCYKDQTSTDDICFRKKRVEGVDNRTTVLNNLKEFTTYIVAIKAATSEGDGPPGVNKSVKTFEARKYLKRV